MALTGIDKRQIQALAHKFKYPAELIAQELGLDVDEVKAAMPVGVVDKLAQAADGWLLIDSGEQWAVWAVKPTKDEGYYSTFVGPVADLCTCKGYRYRDHCTHVDQGKEKLQKMFEEMVDSKLGG